MRVKVREEARRVLRYEKKNRRNDVTGIEREREREKGVQDLKKKKKKKKKGGGKEQREGRREGWKRRNAQENRSEKCIRGGRGSR